MEGTELAPHLQTAAQLEASLSAVLDRCVPGADIWLFAYGSLMWNPMIVYEESCSAILFGYHRGFYLRSRIHRGTPQNPGLVLALDSGGSCRGICYRIAAARVKDELQLLWRREMLGGSYKARWLDVHTCRGRVAALAFVIDRQRPTYAGKLTDDEIVSCLHASYGLSGSGVDYLLQTHRTLTGMGISCPSLTKLIKLIRVESDDNHKSLGLEPA
ncbi:gamma-glutamylcyclotransferase [Noviherbaspirillum saxi]